MDGHSATLVHLVNDRYLRCECGFESSTELGQEYHRVAMLEAECAHLEADRERLWQQLIKLRQLADHESWREPISNAGYYQGYAAASHDMSAAMLEIMQAVPSEILCPGCHLPALYADRYCADCDEFGTPKQRGEE